MQITHFFSNTIGDATGTVTVPNLSGGTSSVAATALPRPTNWNEPHALSFVLAGNTTNASTVSGTQVQFAGSGGIVLGGSASSLIFSFAPSSVSRYNEFKESPMVVGQQGNGSFHIQAWNPPNVTFDRFVLPLQFSGATNSTGSLTVSFWVGIYTRNASTLSLATSASLTTAITYSGTANSTLNSGVRIVSGGITGGFSDGIAYWVGVGSRTTSGGANATLSQVLNSQINSNFSGYLGSTTNATAALSLGHGVYSTTTTAVPGSIAFTQINASQSLALRPPVIELRNGTV